MSRKRDKNKSQECQCPKCQNKSGKSENAIGDNPFGINQSQLLGMLGNADMGQIGNVLSSMNTDGFDFNNLNFGSIQNMMSGMNGGQNNQDLSTIQKMMSGNGSNDNSAMSSIQEMMANMQGAQNSVNNSMNVNNKKSDNNTYDNSSHHRKNKKNDTIDNIEVDENIELLMSIRKIVDYDRAKFIDKVIELYKEGAFEEE